MNRIRTYNVRQLEHLHHRFVGPRRSFSMTAINMVKVSDAIKKDHRELEEYYHRIVGSSDHDVQTRYQNLFVWELARHSIGEELVVYPVLEKSVPDGESLAMKDRAQHQKVKEQLYSFQKLKADEPGFISTLKVLYNDLQEHIKEEEEVDLPKLESAIESSESERLAQSFHRTKNFVPTRSHPSAPDKPPFETAVGLMAAPMDKLMDMLRKFP